MAKDKPRLVRLTSILTHLQSKKWITANEMAEKHSVSLRTIYRDIRTLEASGIPIIAEEGRGYSIVDGYRLPPVSFTEDEANALIIAEKLISKNKDKSFSESHQQAITKIKAVLKSHQKDDEPQIVDRLQIRNNPAEEKTSNNLLILQKSIIHRQVVCIQYEDEKGMPSERTIEPFALLTTHDNWVLIAYCRKRQDFRYFRLDRIKHLEITADTFEKHDLTLDEYFKQCREKWQKHADIPMTPTPDTFA